jgi:hypothetical protein
MRQGAARGAVGRWPGCGYDPRTVVSHRAEPSHVSPAASDPPPRTGLVWALGILGAAGLLALLGHGRCTVPAPYFGTRLGMSEHAVRERFKDAPFGAWTTSSADGLKTLRWTPAADHAGAPAVVFELSEDRVVAIRAELLATDPLARGPAVETSFTTVVARRPEAGGRVQLTVLSRACSKHFAEAARLVAASPRGTPPGS